MASFLVLIDDDRFKEVVAAAENAGLQTATRIGNLNVLVGEISEDKLEAVKAVDGVLSVEPEREVRASDD